MNGHCVLLRPLFMAKHVLTNNLRNAEYSFVARPSTYNFGVRPVKSTSTERWANHLRAKVAQRFASNERGGRFDNAGRSAGGLARQRRSSQPAPWYC